MFRPTCRVVSAAPYRTAPARSDRMPAAIPFLVANETAERFSFYGMRTILVIFMTQYLLDADGALDVMTDSEARSWYHLFASAMYFFPAVGALIADVWWGKFRTIMTLSLVYCLGHAALAMDQTRLGLTVGLTLIAVGAGGIKPCVSANLGDQFGAANGHLLGRAFYWFYFAINLGAGLSTLLTPWLLYHRGPHLAFGVPGLLMLLATWVFWLGRRRYAHIPAGGLSRFRECFASDSLRAMGRLIPIYLFVAFFWALYDQTGSAWVLQARHMDLHWMGVEWLPSQIQFVNPFLILVLIPVFAYGLYPSIDRVFSLTPLRKISIGFFVTVVAFVISASIEMRIASGLRPSIAWQLLAFLVMTAAEVMVSITCLEFSYTQAPRTLKSFVMALFLLSVSFGNALTALVNYVIQDADGTVWLSGAEYYWFFAWVMFGVSLIFLAVVRLYHPQTWLQEDAA